MSDEALDTREAQNVLEDLLRDTILQALKKRLAVVDTIAELRAVTTQAASGSERSNEDFAAVDVFGYRWNSDSTAADNSASVIKPDDVAADAPGRWLKWESVLRFSPSKGADSVLLHQSNAGTLERVIVIDRQLSEEEMTALINDRVPAVAITAIGDDPEELQPGMRWQTPYEFEIEIFSENFRADRQAAQGSTLDSSLGANQIDGLLKALLSGTQLSPLASILNARPGKAKNWISEYGQRRVIRSRTWTLLVTEYFPNAPNEVGTAEEIDFQPQLASLDKDKNAFDSDNFRVSGIEVAWPTDGTLAQDVSSGLAYISGTPVAFAGAAGHVFDPWAETYRDLNADGTLTFTPVDPGSEAPPVATGALRIGRTRTNGISILDDAILCASKDNYGPRFAVPLDE